MVNIAAFRTIDTVTQSGQSSLRNENNKLSDNEKINIKIPNKLILNTELSTLRIAIFSYLYVRRGQDNILYISVNTIIGWMKRKSSRNRKSINYKIVNTIYDLHEMGYIDFDKTVLDSLKKILGGKNVDKFWDSFFPVKFNFKLVQEETDKRLNEKGNRKQYATLYWDEVLKIIRNENVVGIDENNNEIKTINKSNIEVLLVFTYLRLRMGLKRKTWTNPVAALYYTKIANETGVSDKMVSNCVSILSDLGLIYYERLNAYENKDGEKRRNVTLFCSTYNRGYRNNEPILLSSGKRYYMNEIKQYKKDNKII